MYVIPVGYFICIWFKSIPTCYITLLSNCTSALEKCFQVTFLYFYFGNYKFTIVFNKPKLAYL